MMNSHEEHHRRRYNDNNSMEKDGEEKNSKQNFRFDRVEDMSKRLGNVEGNGKFHPYGRGYNHNHNHNHNNNNNNNNIKNNNNNNNNKNNKNNNNNNNKNKNYTDDHLPKNVDNYDYYHQNVDDDDANNNHKSKNNKNNNRRRRDEEEPFRGGNGNGNGDGNGGGNGGCGESSPPSVASSSSSRYNHGGSSRGRDSDYCSNGRRDYRGGEKDDEKDSDRHNQRNGRRSFRPSSSSDWQCWECGVWNYPDNVRCFRCGYAYNESERGRDRDRDRDRHCDRHRDRFRDHGRDRRDRDLDSRRDRDRDRDRDREYGPMEYERNRDRHSGHDRDHHYGDYERRGHSPSERERELMGDENDVDEFGRKRAASSSSSSSSHKNKKKKLIVEWPPCFTANGSAFVFDARSAMFYEAESDFFYDPKSKLYYGNKKGAYFRYDSTKDPPFEEVQKVSSTEGSGHQPSDLDRVYDNFATASGSAKEDEKKLISIKLKSKVPSVSNGGKSRKDKEKDVKANQSTSSSTATNALKSRVLKQHAVNMEKWSEREKEIKGTTYSSMTDTNNTASKTKDSNNNTNDKSAVRTVKGEPVCLLCKRKFVSVDKLRRHEKLSELHKHNLAKKNKNPLDKDLSGPQSHAEPIVSPTKHHPSSDSTTAAAANAVEYRDRAQQRRDLYGPELVGPPPPEVLPSSSVFGNTTVTGNNHNDSKPAEVVRPNETLGDSNIGNQMLQKLGWKSGASLGRKATTTDEVNNDNNNNKSDVNNNKNHLQGALVKDWERIESIAGSTR